MTLYRDIIKRAFVIAWRYKFLWFFGLFATIVGSGGDVGFIMNSINELSSQVDSQGTLQSLLIAKAWIDAMGNIFTMPFLSTLTLFGFLLFFLVILWIVFTSIGGIIGTVAGLEQGKRQTFDSVWKIGAKNFLPIFGVGISAKIILMMLLLIALPIIQSEASSINETGTAMFLVYFTIIFLPIAFIVSLVSKYAMAYIVVRGKSFDTAIAEAFKLFKSNWIVSVEMALIVFGIYIISGFAYIVLSTILTFFLQVFALVGYLIAPSSWWGPGTAMVALFLYALILIGMAAFLAVLEYAAWTKLFMRIEEGRVVSKIMRLASVLPKNLR